MPPTSQYRRVLASQVRVTNRLDCSAYDRSQLILTQGSLLRDLCRDYPAMHTFLSLCRLAINDEAQQGGHAASTILAAYLHRQCLQLLTGDKEQTKAGTWGDPLREALQRLALKSVGFLSGPAPLLPSELVATLHAALGHEGTFAPMLNSTPSSFNLLSVLTSTPLPSSLAPATVHEAEGITPTSGVSLTIILPQSLRCPADPYFSQVAILYPHLHRIRTSDGTVQYGHYEDPAPHQLESRLHKDMKGNLFSCSGYRAIHWNPTMMHFNPMKLHESSTKEIIKMAAVLAYFTAHSISLRSESSKLLLLTPHNDTVADLEAMLGAPETDYPPTLYDFFLTCIYRKHYLANNLHNFPTTVHGETQTAVEQNVTPKRIHEYIQNHSEIQTALVQRCSLHEIVDCCLLYTRGFATYCTISNTVNAIGIGGAASLFISIKMSDFLSSSPEADARNLVALTRSKGLSLIVLPTTTKYFDSALHSITTQCSVRHGLFTLGAADLDIHRFADFLTQPDTIHNGVGDVFNAESWQHTHTPNHTLWQMGRHALLPRPHCQFAGILL